MTMTEADGEHEHVVSRMGYNLNPNSKRRRHLVDYRAVREHQYLSTHMHTPTTDRQLPQAPDTDPTSSTNNNNNNAGRVSSHAHTSPPPPPDDDFDPAAAAAEGGGQDGIFRSDWWIQLGVDDGIVPETRRSHSAALLRLPSSKVWGEQNRNLQQQDHPVDGQDHTPTILSEEPETPPQHTPPSNTNTNTTTPIPPTQETPDYQEFMIVTGGFADRDWTSFPIYAYDLTSTQITPPDPFVPPPEANKITPPSSMPKRAGKWTHLGTETLDPRRQHVIVPPSSNAHMTPPNTTTTPEAEKEEEEMNTSTNSISSNTHADADGHPLWPPGRVGHVSATSRRTGDLYVFGGMTYYDGEFHSEEEAIMWKATGVLDVIRSGGVPLHIDKSNDSTDEDANPTLTWERIIPQFHSENTNTNNNNGGSYTATKLLPRGEAAGGYWAYQDKEYIVFHGGLHMNRNDKEGHHAHSIRGGSGSSWYDQTMEDVAMGDVWAFDMQTETFELLAGYPGWDENGSGSSSSTTHGKNGGMGMGQTEESTFPIARTAHAATITSDHKLIIYGGMAMSGDMGGGWASPVPQWEMLDDVWAFDLIQRRWLGFWNMYPPLARSYHSLVGGGEGMWAACGGYRTTETIAGESIAFVFSDTLVSLKNSTRWYKAVSPTGSTEGLPHRLEHSAITDSHGSLYVWGGRFRLVSQIAASVYRLDLFDSFGKLSGSVGVTEAEPDRMDAYEQELQTLHLMVAAMIFMSVLFTTLYGTLRRGGNDGGENGAVANLLTGATGGGGSGRTNRRGGVRQDVIDSFPVKTFHAAASSPPVSVTVTSSSPMSADGSGETGGTSRSASSGGGVHEELSRFGVGVGNDGGADEEEEEELPCCAICLLEYVDGDEVRTLPCNHDFHKDCVDSWLWNNSSCPACRHSLSAVSQPDSGQEGGGNTSRRGGNAGRSSSMEDDATSISEVGSRRGGPRHFLAQRVPLFLRRPVFSILTDGSGEDRSVNHHGSGILGDMDGSLNLYVSSDDDGTSASSPSSTNGRQTTTVEMVSYNVAPLGVMDTRLV